MLALAQGRAVQAIVKGRLGPQRRLARSIGMGGTASPLGWCMAYDPVVEGLGSALAIRRPTYVDDLAALTVGPAQTLYAMYMLIFASRAVGLEIEMHTCRTLQLHRPCPTALARLAALPVTLCAMDDWVELRGLPPYLLTAVLSGCFGLHRVAAQECSCHLKTALVVAEHRAAWRDALQHSPFGPEVVRESWPSLGATVAGPTRTRLTGQWTTGGASAIATGTWQRARDRAADRAQALATCIASPGRRAAAWNTYIASLLPYPTHIAMPS